ncbi:vanadium-dependent haloperoxidase [Agromyces mariniharenae]|uniref:Vanadium-dependent haloperoxidase n=1 Tax=Agromyces mariniharenae TaxID=2604423 RepID=A0A5S4UVS0_9MICO|nr:vanadium-dependent haloperoxidase [Agromyces mariniharenae]TYL50987.1 vanadium-dependent haloperoxidase [Agromyces mariniharenae]
MTHQRFVSLVAGTIVASAAFGAYGVSVVPLVASAAPPVAADATAVLHWNQVAATTLAAVPGPNGGAPPAFQINMGMTQGAVYDAVNAIGPKQHQPYLLDKRFGAKASVEAAVATAAYDVLAALVSSAPERAPFPGRAALLAGLATEYATSLDAVADGPFEKQGVAAGHAAASAMLEARVDDGRFGESQWVPDTSPGHWWPLLNAQGQPILDPTPWAGGVEPFLIESQSQFRTEPPPALDSDAYAAEVNEVQALGRATGSTRTEHQTYVAKWWQSAPILSWNEVSRQLIERNELTAADSARLLALQNLSGADAAINCWNDKYFYDFWRPWNSIPRADEDDNPATIAEPGWTALITAPYPDTPSGHNCLDAAHVTVMRMFFGDVIEGGFQITSLSALLTAAEPKVRTFDSFSQPLGELIDARIWAGLHYRFADVQGQLLGANVANYGAANYFQAVGR